VQSKPRRQSPLGFHGIIEGGFEVFDDFLSQHVGIVKIVEFFQAFVSEPEDITAGFVLVGLNILRNQSVPIFRPLNYPLAKYDPPGPQFFLARNPQS